MIFAGNGFTTSGGDSKQVSLVKDFGLYPQSYLGATDQGIDVSNIIERVKAVKEIFDNEKIEVILHDNAYKYMDYLRRTM